MMQGITFPGDGSVVLKEFPAPQPGPGEVVVRMRASGMCGSDLHFYRGAVSFGGSADTIQGHEPCGDVHAVGEGVSPDTASVGDRVMIHHYWGCDVCEQCRSGWPQMCDRGNAQTMSITTHGGHAPYAVVPARTLLPLPDGLSYKAGAAIGCGTGTAWGGLMRLATSAGKRWSCSGRARSGCPGPCSPRRSAPGHRCGRQRFAAGTRTEVRRERGRELGRRGPVRDDRRSRRPQGRGDDPGNIRGGGRRRLSVLGKWGRACFIGLPGEVHFRTEEQYKNQWTIMTSWTMSTIQQRRCAEFIVEQGLPIDDLYTHSWSLDQAVEAYQWFDKQSDGKGVFEF